MTAVRVLHARCVLPGNSPAVHDGAIVLDATGTLLDVGPAAVVRPRAGAGVPVTVLGDVAVLPGLVDASVVLAHAALRARVRNGAGALAVRDELTALARTLDPEERESSSLAALDALARAGVRAIGLVSPDGDECAPLARRGVHGTWFAPPGTAAAVHPAFVLAEWLTHPAPSPRARALDVALHPAARTTPWPDALAAHGLLDARTTAVHLTDARADELDALARANVRAVLCPRADLFAQTMLPPLLDLLAAGLRPALGAGSLALVSACDPLADAAALHARFPTVPTATLLAMATAYGAEILGTTATHGTIEPGKKPGLIAVPFTHGDPFVAALGSKVDTRRDVTAA